VSGLGADVQERRLGELHVGQGGRPLAVHANEFSMQRFEGRPPQGIGAAVCEEDESNRWHRGSLQTFVVTTAER
jgi:hypothetical protein